MIYYIRTFFLKFKIRKKPLILWEKIKKKLICVWPTIKGLGEKSEKSREKDNLRWMNL